MILDSDGTHDYHTVTSVLTKVASHPSKLDLPTRAISDLITCATRACVISFSNESNLHERNQLLMTTSCYILSRICSKGPTAVILFGSPKIQKLHVCLQTCPSILDRICSKGLTIGMLLCSPKLQKLYICLQSEIQFAKNFILVQLQQA